MVRKPGRILNGLELDNGFLVRETVATGAHIMWAFFNSISKHNARCFRTRLVPWTMQSVFSIKRTKRKGVFFESTKGMYMHVYACIHMQQMFIIHLFKCLHKIIGYIFSVH